MKIKYWTEGNKSDPLDKAHCIVISAFGRTAILTWATHWSRAEGTYPNWEWRNRPFVRLHMLP